MTMTLNRREPTWNTVGYDVHDAQNVEEMLILADLDYEVTTRKVFTEDGIEIPGVRATAEMFGSRCFGVVSDRYSVVQNADVFTFMDNIPDLTFVKAGMTHSGMVYAIGALPAVTILGDDFIPYVIVQNSFNGKYNIKATICPLRIVCQNQFAMSFKNSENTVTIRHSRRSNFMIEDAMQTLTASANSMGELAIIASKFASVRITDKNIMFVVNNLFAVKDDARIDVRNRVEEERARFIQAYHAEDNTNFRGTAWGLINAYADYLTHKDVKVRANRNIEAYNENRFVTTTFNSASMDKLIEIIGVAA